jgi:hypothetical protein
VSIYALPSCPKYIGPVALDQVNVDTHDAGGVNGVMTGPRLSAAIEPWSLIIVVMVVVLMILERRNTNQYNSVPLLVKLKIERKTTGSGSQIRPRLK